MSKRYELVVIGAGPAGYAAAIRAAQLGADVALIERSKVGGAGIHAGVLPSKTMWQSAIEFNQLRRGGLGFSVGTIEADFDLLMQRVNEVSVAQATDLVHQLEQYRHGVPTKGRITPIDGSARFIDPYTVEVTGDAVRPMRVEGEKFIVATGSRPRQLPQLAADGQYCFTSDEIFGISDFPKSLVIIGAGVIGCEFATIFGAFGKTEVHLIDRAERILPFEDEDIAATCAKNLADKGVIVHQGCDLDSIGIEGDGVVFRLSRPDGSFSEHRVEKALVSIGRIPNTDTLGLENTGVEFENGMVKIDGASTSQPHIFVVGDASKDICLVNVGQTEGIYAAELSCGETPEELCYDHISTIMFLDPAVAAVGRNEQQLRAAGIPHRVGTYSFGLVPRVRIMNQTDGFMKLIVTDDEHLIPLGMRAVGPRASELIESVAMLMRTGQSVREISNTVHPHPASTEGLQDLTRMLEQRSMFDPDCFEGLTVSTWRPE